MSDSHYENDEISFETGVVIGSLLIIKCYSYIFTYVKGLKGKARIPTDDLIQEKDIAETNTLWHFRPPSRVQKPIRQECFFYFVLPTLPTHFFEN